MKNGGSKEIQQFYGVYGGKVKNRLRLKALGASALFCLGVGMAGCKSAPELTQTQALTMIQANYDQGAPQGVSVLIDNQGMVQGATAKPALWNRTKIFPNKYWADFKLTDDGKKAIKLPNGGDTIEWRPAGPDDTHYTVRMVTVAANHLKAKDVGELQDEMLAGTDTAKGAQFTEVVDMTGVPQSLVDIAHNPGNKLSAKRHADFALVNGQWTLKGVQ